MNKGLILQVILYLFLFPGMLLPQAKPVFSGDPGKFRDELNAYMGGTGQEEQTKIVTSFIAKWDSSSFSRENMSRIADISSQLAARQIRAVPQFSQFLQTLLDFCNYKTDDSYLSYWLTGFSELLFNPRFSNESIFRYTRNTSSVIADNLLFKSGSVSWKVKNAKLVFAHDTIFSIRINDATLTCYSQRDSTEIYNASGIYYPDLQIFRGSRGIVTWEKAGFPKNDVFAEMKNYTVNVSRNNFSCDSARLTHKIYFRDPVYGRLTDQAVSVSNKEKAIYPQFETYTKKFRLKEIDKGINFEGGLAFEGAQTKGRGDKAMPAKITLFRNDTLYMKINSNEFIFSRTGLNAMGTEATLYLDKDSIYHTNLGFTYNSNDRQVYLFRTNNPVSASPYYDSYHNLDMNFESLSWNMNGSKILVSRAKGASIGQAMFQSSTFFNSDYFLNLLSLDNSHPLTSLKKFSEYYYSNTFPVADFAKWLKKPEDAVTGLCIDLAKKGFIFYDGENNEVTVKKKVNDFIDAYAGKKDYDVMTILSEAKAPADNAVLDLKTYDLKIMGVKSVFLSDSQKVAIFPYNREIVLRKNRSFEFDGVVQAGLFTIYGHDFYFSYDTFKIRLPKIDSIRVAVETGKKDAYGRMMVSDVGNLIQLVKAELYIDDPNNKSGLKSLSQYPIIDARSSSYIFYDKIPGLEDVYNKKEFYFRVDPFSFENIDHYKSEDMHLAGEFHGGNILAPMRQFLTVQDNNSLGFNMVVPPAGIDIYGGKGKMHDFLSMSDSGLISKGTMNHLSSVTKSDKFRLFPDSMITNASSFKISKDGSGLFPDLTGENIKIKWFTKEDEWFADHEPGRSFSMFDNGTSLEGSIKLTPGLLSGNGIITMTDSRITSKKFTFASGLIKADTADYNFKSPSTSGYAFIADNAAAEINFDLKRARFHLNTDSSMVKLPEIEYICKMTDFDYDMQSKILAMEQKGKSSAPLMPPEKLTSVDFRNLEKPTFIAVSSIRDTISFNSLKASYNVEKEYIEAENINYIHIADALIRPENGKITINRRAKISNLKNAYVAINNRHLIHSADISIESAKRYSGSGVYDYKDDSDNIEPVTLSEITVDTLTSSAKGFIGEEKKFMLNQAFTFTGDVNLSARQDNLLFTGTAGIIHDCGRIKSYSLKFKSYIDPGNVMIPVGEKPRDKNDNILYSGSFINTDSTHIYPAFLSEQKSWLDAGLVTASGVLWYNRGKGRYEIAEKEKIADPGRFGNMVSLDRKSCILYGEGKLNFGANFDLVKMSASGNVQELTDSGKVNIKAILALDFYFSPEALKMISDEIKTVPSLKTVNLNSEFNNKGMKDLYGENVANQLKDEVNLFGTFKNMPKEFTSELVLNDLNLYWNDASSSFRSAGKIGIGFVGDQAVNVYVDGFVDIQRRRSGDMIDIYLKANNSTWYYFSYFKGVMMAQAGNIEFNRLLNNIKLKDRKHPESSTKVPYTYMVAVEDRLNRFLRRMSGELDEEMQPLEGIVR